MISLTASTELFKIWGFSVQTWGSIVALGIIIGIVLMLVEAKKRKLYDLPISILAYMMVLGLIFGRIAYILVNLNQFQTFFSLFEIWKGGIISWGVLLGVIAGILIFKWMNKITFKQIFELADLMAPYLILAVAIGRIGCFLRGCCFGIPTALPWGLVYSGNDLLPALYLGKGLHPTELYHSIADFIIFFVLLKLYKKREKLKQVNAKSRFTFFNKSGNIFLLFIMLYSAERFFIDFLRYHPANEYLLGITITQIIFATLFMVSLFLTKRKI